MSEYTSPVPADHPRVMYHVYVLLIGTMWVVASLNIAMMWDMAGYIVGVVNLTIGLLTRKRVQAMRERIDQ